MLKKEIIFGYLSQGITLLGGIFFLIFLPKLGGIETYGNFMLILSYISLLGILMGTPIQEAIKKELVTNKLNGIGKKYILNAFLLRGIFNIIFFIGFYFVYTHIKGLNDINFLYILGIFLFVNISGLPQNIFLSLHKNKYNFYFILCEYGIQIITILIFYFLRGALTLEDILFAFILGYGVPTLISSIYIIFKTGIHNKYEGSIITEIFKRYFMLGLSSISFVILVNIDNIMISLFFSDKELGYYNVATSIVNKTTIFTIAIVTSILPLFHLKQNKEKITKLFKKYFKLLIFGNISLSFIIYYISPFIIKTIYGSDYVLTIEIMQLMCLFPLFAIVQVFLGGILNNHGKYKTLMKISFSIAFTNIILNYILIKIMGIYGISVSTIVSYLFWCFILFIYTYKIIR